MQSAISSIALSRGEIGSIQKSTLQPNIAVLQDTMVQLSGAEATISNADYGVLMSRFARDQVLLQVSAKALGLANQKMQSAAMFL